MTCLMASQLTGSGTTSVEYSGGLVEKSPSLFVMSRSYRSTLPETTRDRICQLIGAMPGLTSREIAKRLGLDKRQLNQYLYYEGRASGGLYVRNWRWYHSGSIQRTLFPNQVQQSRSTVEPPGLNLDSARSARNQQLNSQKLCGILGSMNELDAIRQIRRLDRVAIEKAFSEEEYPSLTDVLKIELVQRLEELKSDAALQNKQKPAGLHPLVTFLLILVAIPIVIKILEYLSS